MATWPLARHLDEALPGDLGDALRRDREQASEVAAFPGLVVFRLAPWRGDDRATPTAVAEPQPIATSSFRAEASHNPDALARAFDDDLETRWLTGTHQAGDEWIAIAFDRPRDVARVRPHLDLASQPRRLPARACRRGGGGPGAVPAVVSRDRDNRLVVVQLGQGLVRDPLRGPIDIPLPPNQITRLRIRQAGQTRTWFWAVDELSFWER